MSYTRNNANKLPDKCKAEICTTRSNEDLAETTACDTTESRTYTVTVSKKPSNHEALCSNQRSFISIHSTDHLCQIDPNTSSNVEECSLEVLSLKEVFPSTSDESVSNDDEAQARKRVKTTKKVATLGASKTAYAPMNSKSSTGARHKDTVSQGHVFSDYNITKNTLHVVGSNPGEPKMSYEDSPKKMSKTMKNFLRNIDKHKHQQNSKTCEKTLSKLTTMRGILKDGRCGPECTGDSVHESDDGNLESLASPFAMDFNYSEHYMKHGADKSVSFNTEVVIIHFTGDLCVGQSVEAIGKERDQQARNSELRRTFLTKYNELWSTQK